MKPPGCEPGGCIKDYRFFRARNKALVARIRNLFSALNFLTSYFTHFDDILLDHVFDRPPTWTSKRANWRNHCVMRGP
jgi:hypothetical protein